MGEFGGFGVFSFGLLAGGFDGERGGRSGGCLEGSFALFVFENREEVVGLAGEDVGPEEDEGDGDAEGVSAEVCGVGGAVLDLEGLGEEVDDDPETDEPPCGGHEDLDDDEEPEDADSGVWEEDQEGAGHGCDGSRGSYCGVIGDSGVDESGSDGSGEVEDGESEASESVFDWRAEDEEGEHISGDMHEGAVEEGGGDG